MFVRNFLERIHDEASTNVEKVAVIRGKSCRIPWEKLQLYDRFGYFRGKSCNKTVEKVAVKSVGIPGFISFINYPWKKL